jgi:predicted nucleotide-binding protein
MDKLEAAKVINELITRAEMFTYENFSTKGKHGYPDALKPEWIAFTTRCTSIVRRLFGEGSAPDQVLVAGLRVDVLGWGQDKFELAKGHFLGSLTMARDVLQNDPFRELAASGELVSVNYSNKVFVVHGHDENAKTSLELLLHEMGLQPIVLHRQPDQSLTVIEKLERYSDVGYAFVILTPDECAYIAADESKSDVERKKEWRARPNVIFEFGYFVAKLGRSRVCCLHTGDLVLPSDIQGMIYKKYHTGVEEVAYSIRKELKAAGYEPK